MAPGQRIERVGLPDARQVVLAGDCRVVKREEVRHGLDLNGRNAKAALLLRTGDATLEAPPGSRQVARGEGLSAADQRELSRLKTQIAAYLAQGRLRLDRRGQAALQRGDLPNLAEVRASRADPRVLLSSRELDVMIRDHFLVLDDAWSTRFERYADLQHQWDRQTVALFVAPIRAGRS